MSTTTALDRIAANNARISELRDLIRWYKADFYKANRLAWRQDIRRLNRENNRLLVLLAQ